MALDKARLRDHIIFLEASDARRLRMNAREYQTTAREVARVVRCELGDLPMQAFANETLTALETTAQNVFFDSHGRFADLDGSGNALRAQAIGHLLFARLRQRWAAGCVGNVLDVLVRRSADTGFALVAEVLADAELAALRDDTPLPLRDAA